jgi:hypothetical protein
MGDGGPLLASLLESLPDDRGHEILVDVHGLIVAGPKP